MMVVMRTRPLLLRLLRLLRLWGHAGAGAGAGAQVATISNHQQTTTVLVKAIRSSIIIVRMVAGF
jgi:hypothetical protein